MATGSRARLVGRNLFDLLDERYGANSAPGAGGGRVRSDAAPQAGAQQALFRPKEDEAVFQRVCYNADGTCNVVNRATPTNTPREKWTREQRRAPDAERQMELRLTALDRRINDRERLPDDARIADVTGGEIRRAWNSVRWHIDPTGTLYDNRGRGEVKPPNPSGRRDAHTWLSEIIARQATRGDQNYHALHDGVGHALARAVREENDDYFNHLLDPQWRRREYDWRSPYFQRQERRATRRAEALARWLGEDFTYPAERGY